MLLTDLVQIGKLGKHLDENGYINLRITKEFKEEFLKIPDIFLFFKDNRVRLVTLLDVSFEKGYKLRFKELDIVGDGIRSGDIKMMLARDDFAKSDQLSVELDMLGSKVYHSGKSIARVVDVFFNNAYDVFVCEMPDGKEFMIPDVEYYVRNKKPGKLTVRNILELIEL